MKQKRTLFTGIAIGILTSFLVSMMVVPGFAAGIRKTITAYVGDIDIYVDNVLKIPTDANGNRVEPMIYDGTTYLPVRAISNMLGEDVTWDGDTRSIYIGEKPNTGAQSVPLDTLKIYSKHELFVQTGKNAQFESLGEIYPAFNRIGSDDYSGSHITYKLDSEYSHISGKFIMAYEHLGSKAEGTLAIYNVDQYGTETLLKEYTTKCGEGIIDVDVNIEGCNFIKIYLYDTNDDDRWMPDLGRAHFYDISLTTAN